MDKAQSQRIIRETFESKFDKTRFTRFIVELLNLKSTTIADRGVTFNLNSIPNAFHPHINSFEKITDYKSGEARLDILVIRLNKETSIERARTMQRNFTAWYLGGGCDGEQKDAALAAFVSPDENDWRFSLIKMDYSIVDDKKGVGKIIELFTPAKRWSFLVGSNERSHTAQSQLIDIVTIDDKNISLTQLEDAFSVEKVTKEFFCKYRELFFQTKEALDEILSKDNKIKSDFEEKNINTADFTKKLLGQIVFLYFLQKKGWFGVSRDAVWGTGPKNFLRELFKGKHSKYKNFFNDILEPLFYEALRIDRSANDDYYDKFNCKIPFLNGGLFDPIGEYDWVHTDINLPNDLFSNSDKAKEGDTGTGIIDIFDRYNFTVKEDEPLEKEVAVDPEMLGKVFENLLEVKDRKSKGTYYTPRGIVHYMCQQSLINYLATELEGKINKEDIESLFKYGEHIGKDREKAGDLGVDISNKITENASLIDEKFATIKVCDPAVGSGAFLVGMMGEIVRARNVLSSYINNPNRCVYHFKRECIEKSLYGVDIDPGAVEIAKLRLWLSLVVDEDNFKQIKPLPNLDYKIVCGNSLLEVKINLFNQQEFDQLEKIKSIYFSEVDLKKKQGYKQQIEKLIEDITNGHKEFDFKIYFSEIFHTNNGFDVVIANPPYNLNLVANYKNKLRDIYKTIHFKLNLFACFIERGVTLIKQHGVLTYINPNLLFANDSLKKLREYLLRNTSIYILMNLGDGIFESATVPTMIFSLKKDDPRDNKIVVYPLLDDITKLNNGFEISQKTFLNNFNYVFETNLPELRSLLDKVNVKTIALGELLDINQGIITGDDEKYLNMEQRNDQWKRTIRGKDIEKFITRTPNLFVKYSPKELACPRSVGLFEVGEKLLMRRTADKPIASYDDEQLYNLHTLYSCRNKTKDYSLLFLLGLLNSKLFSFIYQQRLGTEVGRIFAEIKIIYIRRLPVILTSLEKQRSIEDLVKSILRRTREQTPQIGKIEGLMKQIDSKVYELYGLTSEEIGIVEQTSRN